MNVGHLIAPHRPRPPASVPEAGGRMRPRVLHVATRYLRGGSETRIRDIIRAFPEARHHLALGADSDVDVARRELHPASLAVVGTLVREPSPLKDVATFRWIAKLLREKPFDLMVTHQSKAGVLGRMAARRAGGPPVVHSLSMASFGPGYPKWQDLVFRFIEAWLAGPTAAYAVVGEDLARRYTAIGVPAAKLRVVRSGIGLPVAGVPRGSVEVRRRFGIPQGRPVVLYLGSLEPRKNVLDLPTYLSRLLAIEAAARPYLLVVGEGPLRGRLTAALQTADLAREVSVVGFVADPGPIIAAADALILLSRAEGVPQALVRAAAAGTPFVGYDVDGVRELITLGANGAVVPLGNVGAAAAATARILRAGRSGGASIDLSSWSPEAIRNGYRGLIEPLLLGDRSGLREVTR